MTSTVARLQALGFVSEGLGGNLIGWVARHLGHEILITDGEGSSELPEVQTDAALLTVTDCQSSESVVSLAGTLDTIVTALERGKEIERW